MEARAVIGHGPHPLPAPYLKSAWSTGVLP
jgi:hypothetical protein